MRAIAAIALLVVLAVPARAGALCDALEQEGRDLQASACRQDEFEADMRRQQERLEQERQRDLDRDHESTERAFEQYLQTGRGR